MTNPPQDEFFIGWQGRAPERMGQKLRSIVLAVGLLGLMLAAGFAALQRTIGPARWEYGAVRHFEGVLVADPAPMLVASAPDPVSGVSIFLLVDPLKHGFDRSLAAKLNLQCVSLEASVIHRRGEAMLEVERGSVAASADLCGVAPPEDLGPANLAGEIVDAKCWLGAMNPGVRKPHRACAIRCLSGGIPPLLVVHERSGTSVGYLLTGPGGEPINDRVLDFVGEPVQCSGRVFRVAGRLVFYADPNSLARLP